MQRNKIYLSGVIVLMAVVLQAQTTNSLGTFTPYSMFGMGEIVRQGTPYNMSMGGIGLSLRDHRYINYLNPASLTARDTLSFMLDMGMESYNLYPKDKNTQSAYNAFNMSHIAFSFPLYKKSAMIVGFTPYSHVGYKFEESERRPELVSEIGNIVYQHFGEGSINQLFLGAALNLSKNFFIGAQGIYYFGTLYKNSKTIVDNLSFNTISSQQNTVVESFAGKFGLQYAGKVGTKSVISAGATYLLPSTLSGEVSRLATSTIGTAVDTIFYSSKTGAQMKIPAEFAVGVSVGQKYFAEHNMHRWRVGFDYTYQDWTKTIFSPTPDVNFCSTVRSAYKLGFEITPDFNDPRYAYKRWTYRGGLYFEETYMQFNGCHINAMGFTLGLSVPVFKWSNTLNFGIDIGQRGSLQDQLVRERYVMFKIGTSLYDIWFQKMKYD